MTPVCCLLFSGPFIFVMFQWMLSRYFIHLYSTGQIEIKIFCCLLVKVPGVFCMELLKVQFQNGNFQLPEGQNKLINWFPEELPSLQRIAWSPNVRICSWDNSSENLIPPCLKFLRKASASSCSTHNAFNIYIKMTHLGFSREVWISHPWKSPGSGWDSGGCNEMSSKVPPSQNIPWSNNSWSSRNMKIHQDLNI